MPASSPPPVRRPGAVLVVTAVVAVLAGVGLGVAALTGRFDAAPGTADRPTAAASATTSSPTTSSPAPAEPAPSAPSPADPAPADAAVDGAPSIAFLGDSLTVGVGAPPGRGYAWQTAERLGWPIALVDGVSGSGFLAPGAGRPLPDRVADVVAARPDVVVVAGGTNDVFRGYPPADVERAATGLLHRLRADLPGARIVVLGPLPSAFSEVGEPEPVREAVRSAARAAGAPYLDAGAVVAAAASGPAQWDRYISDDGLHPNELGYAALADAVAAELAALVR